MKNTTKRSLIIIFLIFLVLILGCCAPQPQSTEPAPQATASPTQTPSPQITETPINLPGVQPITSENISHLDLLFELGEGKILNAAVSPDHKYIAVLSISDIHLYDRITYEETAFHSLEMSINFNDIQFSRDEKSIYFANINKLYRWDYENDNLQEVFASQIANPIIRKISLSPNEDRVIITSVIFDNECENEAHNTALYDMDGNLLYDLNTCDSVSNYHYKFIDDQLALFAVDSYFLQTRADEMAWVNTTTGKIIASTMQWQNNEGVIKTRSTGNTAFVPDFLAFRDWLEKNFPHQENNTDLQTCTGDDVISYFPYNVLYEDEQSIDLLISNTGNIKIAKFIRSTCKISKEIHFSASDTYVFSPDSTLLATTDQLGASVWNLNSGKLALEKKFANNTIQLLSFNSDGSKFITVNYANVGNNSESYSDITIWSTYPFEKLNTFSISMNSPIKIIPTNNPKFMILQDSKYIYIVNIESRKLIRKITGTKLLLDPRLDAVWIPVQRWKNYQILSLFYFESGMKIFELPEIPGKVQALSLNTDQTIITIKKICQNQTSEMQLDLQPNMLSWKIKSTEFPKKIMDGDQQTSGWNLSMDPLTQNDQANKTKPSQNEPLPYQVNTLLLIQDRNSLKIWDYETQQHIAKIQFKYRIDNAVFSPGGNFIAVFGSDGIVRIFGLKNE